MASVGSGLPVAYKQRGSTGKWIFKKAMEDYLPDDVIYRPKTGFGAPLRKWIQQDLGSLLDDVLSERSVKNRGIFDHREVSQLIQKNRSGAIDGAYTIFALVCIELWCRRFVDSP
ncbi:MAG: asparagine synthase C-terminal domain-containing protein [Candidatus Krumholzibacteria bacterium]|nr:asparagine synthase C-terminal domain-containing protein [Candidatus Krumholzibacteria bacterium]